MKTVLVFGTFDVIHPGHKFFLQQAALYGDKLIAIIARDEFVQKTKQKSPVHTEADRMNHIIKSGLVNDACLSDPVTGSYNVVSKFMPNVICFGHDQTRLLNSFKKWLDKERIDVEIVIIDPFKRNRYSSTIRNKKLNWKLKETKCLK